MYSNNNKIAIIIDTLNGGGAEKVCLTLLEGMKTRGIDAHLIVLKKKCSYVIDEIENVHFIYNHPKVKLYRRVIQKAAAKKLNSLINQLGEFDAIVSNLDETHAIVAKANLPNCFYVIHNSIEKTLKMHRRLGPFKYWRNLKAIKSLNGKNLISVSEGIKQEIEKTGRIRAKSITTIYNPVDIEKIRLYSEEITNDIPVEPYIIYIGRIAKQKRIDLLIQSFQLVEAKVDLVVLTNNKKKLNKLIKKYNIKNKTIIGVDFKQNPYPWVKNAKALVLSSDFEGLGMVLIEALVCGTPAVSTNCPHGPNEILTDELAQFLSPVGNSKELAKNIDASIHSNIDSPKILEEVSVENVVSNYLELFIRIN